MVVPEELIGAVDQMYIHSHSLVCQRVGCLWQQPRVPRYSLQGTGRYLGRNSANDHGEAGKSDVAELALLAVGAAACCAPLPGECSSPLPALCGVDAVTLHSICSPIGVIIRNSPALCSSVRFGRVARKMAQMLKYLHYRSTSRHRCPLGPRTIREVQADHKNISVDSWIAAPGLALGFSLWITVILP